MSLEVIVRPAGIVAVLKEKGATQPIATQDDEAYIEWGRGSLNLVDRTTVTTTIGGNTFNWETQFPETPQIPDVPTFLYDEVARKTHVVRIMQEGNPENYVEVAVIDAIAFKAPSGVHVYRFTNPQ